MSLVKQNMLSLTSRAATGAVEEAEGPSAPPRPQRASQTTGSELIRLVTSAWKNPRSDGTQQGASEHTDMADVFCRTAADFGLSSSTRERHPSATRNDHKANVLKRIDYVCLSKGRLIFDIRYNTKATFFKNEAHSTPSFPFMGFRSF